MINAIKILAFSLAVMKFVSLKLSPIVKKPFRLYMSKIDEYMSIGTRGSLHKRVEEALINAFGAGVVEITEPLVVPTQPVHGDYQSNVALTLVKKLGMKPRDIADKIAKSLQVDDMVSAVNITGPGFISMRLSESYVQQQLLNKLHDRVRLGVAPLLKPQRVIVDFSSPNIAKEMHVGHLRSTIIGDSLSRILEFLGHDVLRLNHVGDWGTQFGMLILYLKETYPDQVSATSKTGMQLSVSDLMECYRAAKKRFDDDPQFKESARAEVVKLQSGDSESLRVWKAICDKSRQEFDKIYSMLGVQVNERGESFYNPYLTPLVNELVEKKIAVESQGSKCIFIPGDKYKTAEGDPLPLIVQKSDGGYLYATTDLAALRHRVSEEKADRILYVTDAGQAQHFAMVFDAARAYGLVSDSVRLDHVPFGLVLGEDGKKIKTRSGESVRLKELLDEAVANAERDMVSRKSVQAEEFGAGSGSGIQGVNDMLPGEYMDIAAKVGLAAVKYADLSMNRLSDYRFSFDKMLSLTGNTAPYMMYAYVRIRGIQRKAELAARGVSIDTAIDISASSLSSQTFDKFILCTPEEALLARHLLRLEETLIDVSNELCPNKLCEYLFELSQKFNSFYEKCPVLRAETTQIQASRIALCSLTADTLKLSLKLLGIEAVEKL